MAQERPVYKVNAGSGESKPVTQNEPLPITDEMSEEEKEGRRKINEYFALPKDQQVARLATILDRGILHDRFKVQLPDDLHGEWVRNDQLEIDRMQTLGFWVDKSYATKRALHSDGSQGNVIGDVIHMVTTRANKELIDLVRAEQGRKQQSPTRKDREEEEFAAKTAQDTNQDIPTFSDSRSRTVTASDVRAALLQADAQTRVKR